MTTVAAELAPAFWGEISRQGFTPAHLEANEIPDLGTRLRTFLKGVEVEAAYSEERADTVARVSDELLDHFVDESRRSHEVRVYDEGELDALATLAVAGASNLVS